MSLRAKSSLLGLLDIGSHTIKLYILELSLFRSGWKVIDSLWLPLQIGEDIFIKGGIRQETLNELHHILKRYKEFLASYRVTELKAFITSSLSEASNSETVISRCESILGVPVTIIHPYQENEAIYLAVSHIIHQHSEMNRENLVIFHVGSSSSRIFIQKEGSLILSQTYHTGTLRFSQYLPKNVAAYESYFYPFTKHLYTTIQTTLNKNPLQLIFLNDDIIRMLEHLSYEEKNSLYHLSRHEIEKMNLSFLSLPIEELEMHYGIHGTTITTIRLLLVFFLSLLNQLHLDTLYFPHTVSTFGFAYELFKKDENTLLSSTISSTLSLAKRYHCDEEHAKKVMEYASLIFDTLAKGQQFTPREKLYLQIASLLHDIGYFIGATDHHKNTYELLKRTEIFGLSPSEVFLIAMIARYHRKSPPKKNHPEFMSLDIRERILVTRLSAILRLANALDACHLPIIKQLSITISGNTLQFVCHLYPDSRSAFEVIEMALNNNKSLFENFFGLQVVIERR